MTLQWQQLDSVPAWDNALASLGGHPLQSALWGEARRLAEGVQYQGLAAYDGNDIVALARVESRSIPLLGRVAWIPRGPVNVAADGEHLLRRMLRARGFAMCASSGWRRSDGSSNTLNAPQTIWIDLRAGNEHLLENLDSQWRYGVRRAAREGVVVNETTAADMVQSFYRLCMKISQHKGFQLPASLALMQQLLVLSSAAAPVEARLFVALYDGQLAAGAFVMRAGKHVHYLWGGVDREYNKLRAGEAVQWAVMEWAVAQQCELYDLEGIDPVNNPGTYEFKKKMGGVEVTLTPPVEVALDWRGQLALQALQLKKRWRR